MDGSSLPAGRQARLPGAAGQVGTQRLAGRGGQERNDPPACRRAGRNATKRKDSQRNAKIRKDSQRFAKIGKDSQRFAKIRKDSQSFAKGPKSTSRWAARPCGFERPITLICSCMCFPSLPTFPRRPCAALCCCRSWSLVPGPWFLFPGLSPIHLSKSPARTCSAPSVLTGCVRVCARKRFRRTGSG